MSISGLDNPTDDLVDAIKNHNREIRNILKEIKGSRNFKNGYAAYLDGFELTENDCSYPMYQGDYRKGYEAAKAKYPNRLED
jgi:hypothetical protein